jgi:hypothetical protein
LRFERSFGEVFPRCRYRLQRVTLARSVRAKAYQDPTFTEHRESVAYVLDIGAVGERRVHDDAIERVEVAWIEREKVSVSNVHERIG